MRSLNVTLAACMTAMPVVFAAAMIAAPVSAHAQEASKPADESADIIVTAQRREESLQDVPVSLTVVSADTLQSRGLNEIQDLTLAAPSLQSGADNQFSIRGVGTVSFSDTLESSVAVSIDDVNQGRSFGVGAVFNDVQRVEVLSGPQGLLFGKNASAGLLNIVTHKPELGVTSGSFSTEYTLRDTTVDNAQGVISKTVLNVPVGSKSALRFDGFYSYQQPVGVFIGTGTADQDLHAYGGRAKFLTELTNDLSLYVIGDYNERHGIAGSFDRTYRELGSDSPLVAKLADLGITAGPENFYYAGEGDFHRDESSGGVQGRLVYTLGNGWEISNIAAWRFSKRDQALDTDLINIQQLSINRRTSRYDQFTNELRVAIPASSRLNGQAGLYYFWSKLGSSGQIAGFTGLPAAFLAAFPRCVGTAATVASKCSVARDYFIGRDDTTTLRETNYAAFGQLFYRVTDAFQLLAGARVTRAELSYDGVQQTQASYFVNLGEAGPFSSSYRDTRLSWKFGGQYNLTRDAMVYATYSKGNKGAGFNSPTSADQDLVVRPETAKSLEAGIKTSWLDRHLILNLSLYRTKFANYQVQSLDTSLQTFTITNAASLTTKGAEFTMIAKPFHGLTINGNATLQKAVFGDFPKAQCNPGQTAACGADNTYNAKGTELPNAPRFVGTVEVSYETPISDDVDFYIEGNVYHRSSVNYRVGEPAVTQIGPVDLFGASIGFDFGQISARLFCRNCTNKVVPSFINPVAGDANNGIASSLQQWGFNSVRNIGFSLAAKF